MNAAPTGKPRASVGEIFAFIGIGLGFVVFGFFAVGLSTELVRGIDLERLSGFGITLAIAVAFLWVLIARISRGTRFDWNLDGSRALFVGFCLIALSSLVGGASLVIENADNLGRSVFLVTRSSGSGLFAPAWVGIVGYLVMAVLLVLIGVTLLKLSQLVDSRKDSRA